MADDSVKIEGKKESGNGTLYLIAIGILAVIVIAFLAGVFAMMGYFRGSMSGSGWISGPASSLSYPADADPNQVGNCLDEYIKSVVPSSPLIGHGIDFATSGQSYNVNPALMVAIGQQESSLGTAGIVLRHPYNYYGLTKPGGGWAEFSSWEDAINNQARYLREEYLDKGLTTIPQIGSKYAPVGAANDPNNLNSNWVRGVQAKFDAVIAHCPELGTFPSFAGAGSIVAIAQAELGTHEIDSCNCGPIQKYGGSPGQPWCAFFASWVYRKAGYNMPSIGSARGLYDWFGKNQIAFRKEDGTPQPGDIVYFNHSHTGIVESYENGILHTIEGNTSDMVARRSYNLSNNSDIEGFGRWK